MDSKQAALPLVSHFVSREEILKEIETLFDNDYKLISLVAPPGFGKSSVAIMVARKLQNKESQVLYFNLEQIKSLSVAATRMLNVLGQTVGKTPVVEFQHLLGEIAKKTLVVFDGTEGIEQEDEYNFVEFLKQLGQCANNISMIVTTRKGIQEVEDVFPFKTKWIQLQPLDNSASISLLLLLLPNLSLMQAEKLSKICMGVPLFLCSLCPLALCMPFDNFELLLQELKINTEREGYVMVLIPCSSSKGAGKRFDYMSPLLSGDRIPMEMEILPTTTSVVKWVALQRMPEYQDDLRNVVRQYCHKYLHFFVLRLREIDQPCDAIFRILKLHHMSVHCEDRKSKNESLPEYVVELASHTEGELIHRNKRGLVIAFDSLDNIEGFLQYLGLQKEALETHRIQKLCQRRFLYSVWDVSLQDVKLSGLWLAHSTQIDSVIPYIIGNNVAMVIYTFLDDLQVLERLLAWLQHKEYRCPTYIVNLLSGYATDPPAIPDPHPTIEAELYYNKYSKLSYDITRELAKEHSNLSTVCFDYRIKGNKVCNDEVCIQVGVLTKGLVPLGEKELPKEIHGFAVDVVESSAAWCGLQPMRKKVEPVVSGVGIGLEGNDDRTGTLGAVVMKVDTEEVCLLSCAHVLQEKGKGVVQPSHEDYRGQIKECEESMAKFQEELDALEEEIEEYKRIGRNTAKKENLLESKKASLEAEKERLKKISEEEEARKIGVVDLCVRNNKFQLDGVYYGVDAGIAIVESEEFSRRTMSKMYECPIIERQEIKLNGEIMEKQTVDQSICLRDVDVYKCGRSTGLTVGRLWQEISVKMPRMNEQGFVLLGSESTHSASMGGTDTDDHVWYKVLRIRSTHKSRSFCEPGDSGAVVFDESGNCVGLLFGWLILQHENFGGGLATPMHVIREALGVRLASAEDFAKFLAR